jgi:Stage II sporulation protein E (SpoIIE)
VRRPRGPGSRARPAGTELIPAAPRVGRDFFCDGDGPTDALVAMIGDVVGKGLTAARRAAFTRTAFASVAPFSDDPFRLLELVNVALVKRIGESQTSSPPHASPITQAAEPYEPPQPDTQLRYGWTLARSCGPPASASGRALGLASTGDCTEVDRGAHRRRGHPPLHRRHSRSPRRDNALRVKRTFAYRRCASATSDLAKPAARRSPRRADD